MLRQANQKDHIPKVRAQAMPAWQHGPGSRLQAVLFLFLRVCFRARLLTVAAARPRATLVYTRACARQVLNLHRISGPPLTNAKWDPAMVALESEDKKGATHVYYTDKSYHIKAPSTLNVSSTLGSVDTFSACSNPKEARWETCRLLVTLGNPAITFRSEYTKIEPSGTAPDNLVAITPKIGGLILTPRSEHKNKIFTASLVAAFALADPAAAEEEAQQDKTAVVTWTFKVEDKPTFGTNQSKWNTTKVPDRKGCVGGRWRTATPAERRARLACADPPAPPALPRSVLGMAIILWVAY